MVFKKSVKGSGIEEITLLWTKASYSENWGAEQFLIWKNITSNVIGGEDMSFGKFILHNKSFLDIVSSLPNVEDPKYISTHNVEDPKPTIITCMTILI